MSKTIAIIGGDKRMVYLAKMMSKEKKIITYGQELVEEEQSKESNIKLKVTYNFQKNTDSLKRVVMDAKIIIAPIPFSKDGKNVYAEFSKNIIPIEELMSYCKGKTLIAGAITKDVYNIAQKNNVKIIDLMQNESLTILNTIATAEGAIEIAIRKREETLHGSNVLILGYGRVGKEVAKKFEGLSANITCAARKEEAFAWIEADGYKYININELGDNLKKYDIIINTPPTLILNKERLQKTKKDCLVIDLASKPGGVDNQAVKELNINFEWALALPGKVAPLTSAKYIKRALENI